MTTAQLRVRLALALGLPATACSGPAPKPAPVSNVAADASRFSCGVDQVQERVCGIAVPHWPSVGLAGATGRYESCPANATALGQFDQVVLIDQLGLASHAPELASFHYDAHHTFAFAEANGDVAAGVVHCCYNRCHPLQIALEPRPITSVPAGKVVVETCVPEPESASHPAKDAPACPAGLKLRIEGGNPPDPYDDAPFSHVAGDHLCCYAMASSHRCGPRQVLTSNGCMTRSIGGRPLRDGADIVVAPPVVRQDWRAALAVGTHDEDRADAWRRAAAYEHASVAAFARLAIELLAVGAPPELVDDAHAAARDEIRHAKLCYGLASAYGARDVGPGPLPLAMPRVLDLAELAVECFRDGCVDETIAAIEAEEQVTGEAGDDVRAALREIANDEARHAELSYRIVAWALREGGEPVRARLAEEVGRIVHEPSDGLRRRVVDEVVLPTAMVMLAS